MHRDALERQIAEKKTAAELEQRRDAAFADRMLVTEQRVQLMERDVQRVSLRAPRGLGLGRGVVVACMLAQKGCDAWMFLWGWGWLGRRCILDHSPTPRSPFIPRPPPLVEAQHVRPWCKLGEKILSADWRHWHTHAGPQGCDDERAGV